MSGLDRAFGRLEERVASLERDNAMFKQYGLRAALLAILLLIGAALNVKASVMTDLVLELLKRS